MNALQKIMVAVTSKRAFNNKKMNLLYSNIVETPQRSGLLLLRRFALFVKKSSIFLKVSALLLMTLAGLLFPAVAFAAVGVSSSELQAAAGIILPSGDAIGALEGYSSFKLQSQISVQGGIVAQYEARLIEDPWFDDELPQLKIVVYSYSDQAAATFAFNSISPANITEESAREVIYSSDDGSEVAIFGSIDSEYFGFHHILVNGNLLYQVSLYREDGPLKLKNIQTYAAAIKNTRAIQDLLQNSLDSMLLGTSILFPPTQSEFAAKNEKNSIALEDVPKHGSLDFNLYISDPAGALGTVLDSSGLSEPEEGDLYLYLNSEGRLFAGLYAPNLDADCPKEDGWTRLAADRTLRPYEWNAVSFGFGVEGFSIDLNGRRVAECAVSQARGNNVLYFGDFPGDSIEESMIGYLSDMDLVFSLTQTGQKWDDVLLSQIFLDLPSTDPDVRIFQFLQEKGIFVGSAGMLRPEEKLNRAEMVKTLLKTFNYSISSRGTVPFEDVSAEMWFRDYVARAYEIGMVKGHDSGLFLPATTINHAEFYTMLQRIDWILLTYDDSFEDVFTADWYYLAAGYAFTKGLVTGPQFEPDHMLTRREAAHALYSLLNE